MSARTARVLLVSLAFLMPAGAWAQNPAATTPTTADDNQSRLVIIAGGTTTTLRGDCQEDCPQHGTGAYLNTGSVLAMVGFRVNPLMDAGLEVSWVPAETPAGQDFRSTFLLAVASFQPWHSRGLFIKGGMGMTFVRNFVYTEPSPVEPITQKALGLTYGIGWTFRRTERVGVQVFGSQHVASIGDFQAQGVPVNDVMANFWSFGGALIFR